MGRHVITKLRHNFGVDRDCNAAPAPAQKAGQCLGRARRGNNTSTSDVLWETGKVAPKSAPPHNAKPIRRIEPMHRRPPSATRESPRWHGAARPRCVGTFDGPWASHNAISNAP